MFSAASPPASLLENWRLSSLNPAFSMHSATVTTSLRQHIHQSMIFFIPLIVVLITHGDPL
ncbi:hypothetical protein MA16_Dca022157 [Dendrobium catenatum]|uniref:Uncharacterized protein n=1 Tax=Dendrobium catenatum TaxID=906689 RepID=A0A2I0VJQ7_9ASPA|nr:hypothetical protein MA16_Dca022157 [Dendrobium catenatum]